MEKDFTILIEAIALNMKYQREARAINNDAQLAMAEIRYEAGKKEPIEEKPKEEPACESPAPQAWRPDAGFWVGATWVAAGAGIMVSNVWINMLLGFPMIYPSITLAISCVLFAPKAASNRRGSDKAKKPPFGMSNAQYNGL